MNDDQKITDEKVLENQGEQKNEELKPEQLDEVAGGNGAPGKGGRP